MPFITAPLIHDGHRFLPAGASLEVSDDGTIVSVAGHCPDRTTSYDGMLAPGFVNAHCHLELSHMKGLLPEHTGLIPFLQAVTFRRNDFSEEQKKAARHEAYEELLRNGIVAVGDIANGKDTLDLRSLDRLHVHTFVECIGFTDSHAHQRLAYSAEVLDAFREQNGRTARLSQSLVPHAPYSVSEALFRLIDSFEPGSLLSIHNEETEAENAFYRDKSGAVNTLLEGFGIDASFFRPSGKSSLKTYGEWISPEHPLILVHNTFSDETDCAYLEARFPDASWCLCPNANRYIEDRLPDIASLVGTGFNICIGTDSLASNHQLSVLAELNTIRQHYPSLDWELLLRWGTFNGARALQLEDTVGQLRPGMRPGILNISEDGSSVQRLY